MMVVVQSKSIQLIVEGHVLYYPSRKEAREARQWYISHGFKVGK